MDGLPVSHKLALLAREVEFDEACRGYYNENGMYYKFVSDTTPNNNSWLTQTYNKALQCTAPTKEQLIKWLNMDAYTPYNTSEQTLIVLFNNMNIHG